jgi:hypothetical protein
MDDIKHHQVALDLQQGTIKAEPGEDIGQLIMERHPCAVIENEDDYSVLALSGPAVSGDGRELMFLGIIRKDFGSTKEIADKGKEMADQFYETLSLAVTIQGLDIEQETEVSEILAKIGPALRGLQRFFPVDGDAATDLRRAIILLALLPSTLPAEIDNDTRTIFVRPMSFLAGSLGCLVRADLARLSRRTWSATMDRDFLQAHLALYIAYHNGYPV